MFLGIPKYYIMAYILTLCPPSIWDANRRLWHKWCSKTQLVSLLSMGRHFLCSVSSRQETVYTVCAGQPYKLLCSTLWWIKNTPSNLWQLTPDASSGATNLIMHHYASFGR